MKVTLLIAMWTLVVLLQHMHSAMAKPQVLERPPVDLPVELPFIICESIAGIL